MNRLTMICAVALAALMCAPAALSAGGWKAYGVSEPGNKLNTAAYMFQNAPNLNAGDLVTNKVYFAVYIQEGTLGGNLAVNDATLGSHVQALGTGSWRAILGQWADCNHDGFIGLADGAMIEYQASVSAAAGRPVDTNICPDLADTAGTPTHNHNGWITELIPVVPATSTSGTDNSQAAANNTNYRLVFDPALKVWGDPGVPVTPGAPSTATGCSQATINPPFANGNAHHTGGMLAQVECDSGVNPANLWSLVARQDPTGHLQAMSDPTAPVQPFLATNGPLDVQEPGTDQACKGEPKNPPAEPCPNGSNAIVSNEFDCSANSYAVNQHPSAAGKTANVTVRNPGSPSVNPTGTVPATINETLAELPSEGVSGVANAGGNCNAAGNTGSTFYGRLETSGGPANVAANNKQSPSMEFSWQGPQPRGPCQASTVWQQEEQIVGAGATAGAPNDPIPGDPALVPPATCGQPNDYGVTPLDGFFLTSDDWWDGTNWIGLLPSVGSTGVDRTNLTVSPALFPAQYYTFYASVSASSGTLPGGSGTYGAEFCPGGISSGATGPYGWDCDPHNWNIVATTGLQNPHVAKVGDAYSLRDVECYDTSLVSGDSSVNPLHKGIGPQTLGSSVAAAGC